MLWYNVKYKLNYISTYPNNGRKVTNKALVFRNFLTYFPIGFNSDYIFFSQGFMRNNFIAFRLGKIYYKLIF